MCICWCVT